MNYESYDQEIDLKDMFFYAVHHWRIILLAGLIFAVVLGGFKYWKVNADKNAVYEKNQTGRASDMNNDEINKKEEEILGHDKELFDLNAQIKAVQKAIDANKNAVKDQQNIIAYNKNLIAYNNTLLKEAEYYLNNSVLLKVADNKPVARRRYQIYLNDDNTYQYYRDPADEVLAYYIKPTVAKTKLSGLAEKYSLTQELFEELYYISNDYTANTVTVTASGIDRQMAEEILETVCNEMKKDGGKSHISHTLTSGPDEYYEVKDKGLIDSRNNYTSTILNYKNNINSYENAINAANSTIASLQSDIDSADEQINLIETEKTIYENKKDLLYEELTELKETEFEKKHTDSGFKNVIKFVLIGFFAGVAVLFIFYLALYALNPVLRMPEDVKAVYGYPILGVLNKKHSSRTCEIDKWIMKAENRGIKICDDEVIKTAAVSIANLVKSGSKIALFTTLKPRQSVEIILAQLSKELPDIDFVLLTEGVSKASNVDELSHCDEVILVEERGETSMNRLSEDVDQIRLLNKQVVGAIIM